MKGQTALKVTSILMIIGSVIAAVTAVIAILGVSALVALAGSTKNTGLLYTSLVLMIVASIIQFIAGIKGIGACSAPQKAASCIIWGFFIAGLSIASMIVALIGGGEFNLITLVLNLLLPGFYVYGAMQVASSINV